MKDDLTFRLTKGSPLTFDQFDANFDRLLYGRAEWLPGEVPYTPNELVYHQGGLWYCITETSLEPRDEAPGWVLYSPRPGKGAAYIGTPPVSGPPIGSSWTPLTQFDTENFPARGMSYTLGGGEFQLDWPGTWQLGLTFSFAHNESQQARETDLRVYDVTNNTPGDPTRIFIARNQTGTNYSFTQLLDIPYADVGHRYQLEMGNGDDLLTVFWIDQGISFLQVSP